MAQPLKNMTGSLYILVVSGNRIESQRDTKFEIVQAKKLVKTNKSISRKKIIE